MKILKKINIQLACVMRLISVNPELGSHPNYIIKYPSILKKNYKKNNKLPTKFFSTVMKTKSFFIVSK